MRIKRNKFIHVRVPSGNAYIVTVKDGTLSIAYCAAGYKDRREPVLLELQDPDCFKKAIEAMT